jgi:hypothetical protein
MLFDAGHINNQLFLICLYSGWNLIAIRVHACLRCNIELSPARGKPNHQFWRSWLIKGGMDYIECYPTVAKPVDYLNLMVGT